MGFLSSLRILKQIQRVFIVCSVCSPVADGAADLVKEMLKQVVTLHPDIKYLHIGCDEVR